MCGIWGFFNVGGFSDQDTAAVVRMTELMARRGSDDEGFWTDGRHCALSFRRLAFLDLSPARYQPTVTLDGRYILVYNGEGFRNLRAELENPGKCRAILNRWNCDGNCTIGLVVPLIIRLRTRIRCLDEEL